MEDSPERSPEKPENAPANEPGAPAKPRRKGQKRTSEAISAIMRKVHSSETEPEQRLHAALAERGLAVEAIAADLPGRPDLVLRDARLAIFVDGDFWHGGQWVRRGLTSLEEQFPETEKKAYWLRKVRRNMRRDCQVTAELTAQGWTVLRFWETDLRKRLEQCVEQTLAASAQLTRDSKQAIMERAAPYSAAPDSALALVPRLTVAEFFAGIGLMRLGLEQAGWRVVYANDIDARKRAMYQAHFASAPAHFDLGDVHTIDVASIPSVTLATASFPCVDLSLAGPRNGLDGRGSGLHPEGSGAFWGFIRVLAELDQRRPPFVLLENVTGFLTSHQGEDFRLALETLNGLGYRVDALVLDAAHFVPQSRERMFVIGVREDLCADDDPLTLQHPAASVIRPKALAQFIWKHPQIRWTLRALPEPQRTERRLKDILEDLPDASPEWWSAERAERLLSQMSPRHRAIADAMIAGEDWSYGTVFRRMRPVAPQGAANVDGVVLKRSMAELRTDGIAGCLRTPKGGSAKQILFKAGHGRYQVRLITPREAARLMGADEFRIEVPRDRALFGFGDAVCVPAIEWIATHYLNPLISELIHSRPLR